MQYYQENQRSQLGCCDVGTASCMDDTTRDLIGHIDQEADSRTHNPTLPSCVHKHKHTDTNKRLVKH
ncbi:hypothetical protein CesoFtcFv8_011166 [Champsocephalus esox]|uniref:Uncharacterized protein n=2 Tax=Champsocephalus TaxID=52236 RepID=A0AAN8DJQ4_CHAGU|nr:hypothetical protein CesoFtcFv8_011166 [Champsocephalus esox]KAK5923522.1 hypothetical protein CgunFtcFv8_000484 [Champsocephalus gunnari]